MNCNANVFGRYRTLFCKAGGFTARKRTATRGAHTGIPAKVRRTVGTLLACGQPIVWWLRVAL